MELSESQRADLARRARDYRLAEHGGNRQAAYRAVGVNSATWSKVESGVGVAERSLVRVVMSIWPESGGDWERITPPLGAELPPSDFADEVRASNLSSETKAYILERVSPKSEPAHTERGESA